MGVIVARPLQAPQSVNVISSETWNEIPSGLVNGITTAFTLAHVPSPGLSLRVYVNGQRQFSGSQSDYLLTGSNTIQFLWTPNSGSNILADYRF